MRVGLEEMKNYYLSLQFYAIIQQCSQFSVKKSFTFYHSFLISFLICTCLYITFNLHLDKHPFYLFEYCHITHEWQFFFNTPFSSHTFSSFFSHTRTHPHASVNSQASLGCVSLGAPRWEFHLVRQLAILTKSICIVMLSSRALVLSSN